jgi:parallel beta-helix repeat protein
MKTILLVVVIAVFTSILYKKCDAAQKVVVVGKDQKYEDVQSAIDAYEKNYIIKIQAGQYRTGETLTIANKRNLTIEGEGTVELMCVSLYEDVVTISGSSRVTLRNIRVFHEPFEPGDCGGNVVVLQDCKNITITECHLNGCGATGVEGRETRGVRIENCEIYNNSLIAFHFENSQYIKIRKNHIYENFQNTELRYCKTVYIGENVFANNEDQQIAIEEVTGLKLHKNKPAKLEVYEIPPYHEGSEGPVME